MSIVCRPRSITHTSGKLVNLNMCIVSGVFFEFFLPQMIHYMTVNQELGVEWSPMPLHMHTSIAQSPTPPLHRIQEIWMCRAVLGPWCQRWLNPEACNSKPHLVDPEWRRNWERKQYEEHVFSIRYKYALAQKWTTRPGCSKDDTRKEKCKHF